MVIQLGHGFLQLVSRHATTGSISSRVLDVVRLIKNNDLHASEWCPSEKKKDTTKGQFHRAAKAQ